MFGCGFFRSLLWDVLYSFLFVSLGCFVFPFFVWVLFVLWCIVDCYFLLGFFLFFFFFPFFFPPDSVWVESCSGRGKSRLEVIHKKHSASGSYDNLWVFITGNDVF